MLEVARHDFEDEADRMRVLDLKLSNLAAFSGVSISITSTLGGSVVVAGRVPLGFQIALGSVLTVASLLLLWGVVTCFRGLKPKAVLGIDVTAARRRLMPTRLKRDPALVTAELTASSVAALDRTRTVNATKADATAKAFWRVGSGFAILLLSVPLAVVGSVI